MAMLVRRVQDVLFKNGAAILVYLNVGVGKPANTSHGTKVLINQRKRIMLERVGACSLASFRDYSGTYVVKGAVLLHKQDNVLDILERAAGACHGQSTDCNSESNLKMHYVDHFRTTG